MIQTAVGLFLSLILLAIGNLILYFVIRLAVRHALQDADERRARSAPSQMPPYAPGPRP